MSEEKMELVEVIAKAIEESGALDDGTGHSPPIKCSNLARACLAEIEASGMVVVPREPSDAMLKAAHNAVSYEESLLGSWLEWSSGNRKRWAAAIAAAPKP